MNIERKTSSGTTITIIHDSRIGVYVHPCVKHEPEYIDDGNRILGPLSTSRAHNERTHSARITTQKAVAHLWADEIVNYMEQAGL